MKYFLLSAFLACVACSSSTKEEAAVAGVSMETAALLPGSLDIDGRIKRLSGDYISISIDDEEQNDSTLLPVSNKFYEQFIKNNSLFEKKRNSVDYAEGPNVNHYFWGQIENTSDYSFLLVAQREELDFAVNKVFLFVFDNKNKLKSITPVAELGYYPGRTDIRYSVLQGGRMLEFVSVQEDIIDEDNTGSGNTKYLIEKDSILIRYAFEKGKFNRTYSDNAKTSSWTK